MSYLGSYYISMEQDKTELEKVLDVYSAAKQIKYIYDEKNKLIPVDRIGKSVRVYAMITIEKSI